MIPMGFSSNLREASTHLAIPGPLHLNQDLDIDAWHSNDSIALRSHFAYPSYLNFSHP
jgi:hypothetical protein